MKAVVLIAYGGVDQLELRDVPDPVTGPHQLKIRMAGASINPIDWKLRSGALKTMMPLVFPAILGRDASGLVVEVGAGVTAFKVGDRVTGLVWGAYAEFVIAPTDAWIAVPASMDIVDAGALPLVLLTGAQLVEEAVNPHAGDVGRRHRRRGKRRTGRGVRGESPRGGGMGWCSPSPEGAGDGLGADGVVALDDEDEVDKLSQLDSIADTVAEPPSPDSFERSDTVALLERSR